MDGAGVCRQVGAAPARREGSGMVTERTIYRPPMPTEAEEVATDLAAYSWNDGINDAINSMTPEIKGVMTLSDRRMSDKMRGMAIMYGANVA